LSDLARQLLRYGLVPGDVVVAIGGNSSSIWALLNATEAQGLVLAIFNDGWSPRHLRQLSQKLGPKLVVGYGARREALKASFIDVWLTDDGVLQPARRALGWARSPVPSRLVDDVRGAVAFCTSGSTGDSKCVVSSARNRTFSVSTIGRYLGLSRRQCIINALSPSFDYGFYQGLLASEFGLKLQLVGSPQMTGEILQRIREEKRTVLPLTPALAARLVRALAPGEIFAEVEIVTLTGGASSLGLRQQLARAFPNARIFAMYGLTECKRVAYLDPSEFLEQPLSCGREMPGVTGTIVDSSGQPVGVGQVGELAIKGENVCLGYWGDPIATARRFRRNAQGEVMLFTGDRFRRDQDGRLEFVSRSDRLVKLRDERVSLGAIETELRRSDLVLDLALDVIADDLGIPQLKARVVPHDPWVTEGELMKSFRQSVSRAGHLPHHVVITPEILLNPHGKHAARPEPALSAAG
jgi:acyl-coenzyme A synthetase/AMP-(fatty) acid ligase